MKIDQNHIEELNRQIPQGAWDIHKTLTSKGYPTYLVGGWVRNYWLSTISPIYHNNNRDIDLTTQATPEEIIRLFPKVVPTGIKHGTVTVIIHQCSYEVTTFRKDGKYSDHRHPDQVSFSSDLQEDLRRRDFTINALAYEPQKKEMVDLFGGMDDILHKKIKAITSQHDLPDQRFQEDALRMMRACRFAAQLDFTIESPTLSAMTRCASLIQNISQERIRDELNKMVVAPYATKGLEYLRETGIMDIVLPELSATFGVEQNRYHAYDVYGHSLQVLKAINQIQYQKKSNDNEIYPSYQLSLSALFHDIAKPQTKHIPPSPIGTDDPEASATFYRHEIIGAQMTKDILKRLKFPKKDIDTTAHLVRHHMFHYTPDWKDGTVRRFVKKIGIQHINNLFLLRQADRLGKGYPEEGFKKDNIDLKELQERIDALISQNGFLNIADLAINGHELMEKINIPAGPLVGTILKELLDKVLDDPSLNKNQILLRLAQKIATENSRNGHS